MQTHLSTRRWGRALSGYVAAALLTFCVWSRPADAYIDPGTGGAIFSALVPILGAIAVTMIAVLGFARHSVKAAFSFFWRHRLCVLGLMAGAAAGAALYLAVGDENEGPAVRKSAQRGGKASENMRDESEEGEPRRTEGRGRTMREAFDEFIQRGEADLGPAEDFRLFSSDEYPHIQRTKVQLERETRSCFVFERSGSVQTKVVPQAGQGLVFAVAADFAESASGDDTVEFRLYGAGDGKDERLLLSRAWEKDGYRPHWESVFVDLTEYVEQPVSLRFEAVRASEGQSGGAGPLCLVSAPRLTRSSPSEPPNVILCTIETLRRDHVSVYGCERKTTPFLEELAKESIVFTEAYSQSSWTKPSIASILSGLYPSRHGACTMLDMLSDSVVTLPEVLRKHGYVTAAFCTSRVISDPVFDFHQGFDVFVRAEETGAEKLKKRALNWLDAERPRPFFLFLHLFDPHQPYSAPRRFRDMFDPGYTGELKDVEVLQQECLVKMRASSRDKEYIKARYDGQIRYADTVLGELARDLEERHMWDNTLMVVSSDHGEEFFEHGNWWGHSRNLMIEKLRIPLLVKLPGEKGGGRSVSGPASHVDLMPTILEALDIPGANELPGIDLLKGMETSGRTGRQYHFAEFRRTVLDRDDPLKPKSAPPHYSVISERYQYIVEFNRPAGKAPQEFLFDLEEDPAAQQNCASGHADVLRRFRRAVADRYLRKCYVIAVNGDGKRRKFSGSVRSGAPIVGEQGLRIESDDSIELSSDKRILRFELTVTDDDDLLYFQTESENASVSVFVDRGGEPISPRHVFLGPGKEPCSELPLTVPPERCAVDADLGEALQYETGKEPGVFIWRQQVPGEHKGVQATPDEDTLQRLKDLGYL